MRSAITDRWVQARLPLFAVRRAIDRASNVTEI
jgi:hypothetical protein